MATSMHERYTLSWRTKLRALFVGAFLGLSFLTSAENAAEVTSAIDQSVMMDLNLTSVCSNDPTIQRRWRVSNPNNFSVQVNWQLYGSNQNGTITADPGMTYFFSNTEGNNTMIISWNDNGTTKSKTKASGGATCPPVQALNLVSVCSNDPSTSLRWRVDNPNAFQVAYTIEIYGSGNTVSGVADPGVGYLNSFNFSNTSRAWGTTGILRWEDNGGATYSKTKASGLATCDPVINLQLTSMCSTDPAQTRRWRVRNQNNFDVTYTYLVVGTQQTGQLVAKPGDNFFETNTVGGANTTKIIWVDNGGDSHETVKASGGAQCCVATNVIEYLPGLDKFGNPIHNSRRDSTLALGIPEGDDTYNFVTLGFGGEIILGFGGNVLEGPGADLKVTETSFGNQTCAKYPEKVEVWVTQDFVMWKSAGTICLDGTVDFGPTGYTWAAAVKLVDQTPNPSPSRDGYDVDGVECLHGTIPTLPNPQCTPDSVLTFSQGTRKDGQPVHAMRSDENKATGTPEDDDTYNFFTLGTGGTITLFFSQGALFQNPAGDDFRVVETSFGDPTCRRYPESAKIEVSQDGLTYFEVANPLCLDGNVEFGNSTGLAYIRYIRITDVSKLFGGNAMDYYDVDGVECLSPNGGLRTAPKSASNGAYIESDYLQMFPNPANSSTQVFIRAESIDENDVKVEIYDMMGSLRYSKEATGIVEESINLNGFTPGVYIVKIDMDGTIKTKKLIVE